MIDMIGIDETAKALKERMAKGRIAPAGTYKDSPEGACSATCEICGGSGWVRWDRPRTDPRYGKLDPCPSRPADQRHVLLQNGLYMDEQDALAWEIVKPTELESLIVRTGDKSLTPQPLTAKRAAEGIAKFIDSQGWGMVYLYGPYGHAKSLILKIAIAEAARTGKDAHYTNMIEILDNIRDAYDERRTPRESAVERLARWMDVPILAIDEFEKFPGTSWERARAFQLIDRRNSAGFVTRGSLTLIASNKRPEDIDGAIASRVHDGRNLYVEMIGKDARPAMTTEDRF
jgi:hypothetical protein